MNTEDTFPDDHDDSHFCLRCRKTIQGLQKYIQHRNENCQKEKKEGGEKSPNPNINPNPISNANANATPSPILNPITNTNVNPNPNSIPNANVNPNSNANHIHHSNPNVNPSPIPNPSASDFFQSLELREKTPSESRSRRLSATFMESLGLSINPRTTSRPSEVTLPSPRGQPRLLSPRGQRDECFDENLLLWPTDQDLHQVFSEGQGQEGHEGHGQREKPSLISFAKHKTIHDIPDAPKSLSLVPSQNDFMRQIDLMNVSTLGVEVTENPTPSTSSSNLKFRLWNPESQEEGEDIFDVLAGHNEILLDQNEAITLIVDSQKVSESQPKSSPERVKSPEESPRRGSRQRLKNKRYAEELEIPEPKSKARQDLSITTCPTCRHRVSESQFGKHLISHYHVHHSKVSKDDPRMSNLVLHHIEEIVKLAPFRCEVCSFYCNWEEEFFTHWKEEHGSDANEGHFWCSFCTFMCESAMDMMSHLKSDKHTDIVIAIGRVVPIVIRRINLHNCPFCPSKFRLNFSLRRHVKTAHKDSKFTLQNHDYYLCDHCNFKTLSTKVFTSHQFLAHPDKRSKYNCFICKVQFHSKKSCEEHRKSLGHRTKIKEKDGLDIRVICDHCEDSMPDLESLKIHLAENHFQKLSQCGKCGDRFAVAQDLGYHVRRGCVPAGIRVGSEEFRCKEDGCRFGCDSLNMLLYHEVMGHGNPELEDGRILCKFCGVIVKSRSKLRDHVKIHGNAFRCKTCYRVFGTISALNSHVITSHDNVRTDLNNIRIHQCEKCDYSTVNAKLLSLHEKRTHFVPKSCSFCGQMFQTFKKYHQHLASHSRKSDSKRFECSVEGCKYVAKTRYDLKSHQLIHSDAVQRLTCTQCQFSCKRKSELNRHFRLKHEENSTIFSCDTCQYSSKSKQHLERHRLTHKKELEILACRHCDQGFYTFDGLRKHVLKTNRHPGLFLFQCDYCEFKCNSQNEFKSHCSSGIHANVLGTEFEALQYVKNYFVAGEGREVQLS